MFMTMCQVIWWANSGLILMMMVVFVQPDEAHEMNSGLIFMTVQSVSWRASCPEQWFATYDGGCVCSAGRGPWREEGPGAAAEDGVRHADHPAEDSGPQHACHGKVGTFRLAGHCLSVGVCVSTVLYREFKAQQHTLWKSMQGYVPKRGGASRACAMGRPVPVFVLSLCLPVHRCVGPHVCKFVHFEGSPGLQYAHHR